MFLHLSVILFIRGSSVRGLCPGGLCPGVSLSRGGGLCPGVGVSVQGWESLSRGGLCLGGSLSSGGLCPGGVSVRETPRRTITCGWYASYWNAFLFQRILKLFSVS